MSDRTLLAAADRDARLADLPGWTRDGDWLVRAYTFAGFDEAMTFINNVADIARDLDHHPNLSNVYNQVELRLSTHDAGGLTALDFEFAGRVSELT